MVIISAIFAPLPILEEPRVRARRVDCARREGRVVPLRHWLVLVLVHRQSEAREERKRTRHGRPDRRFDIAKHRVQLAPVVWLHASPNGRLVVPQREITTWRAFDGVGTGIGIGIGRGTVGSGSADHEFEPAAAFAVSAQDVAVAAPGG